MVKNTRKVTVGPNLGKNGLFQHFLEIETVRLAKMLDIMVRMYGTPSIWLGKLSFIQNLGKMARNLSINQIASTSKLSDRFMNFFV